MMRKLSFDISKQNRRRSRARKLLLESLEQRLPLTTCTVMNGGDAGAGSLRQCIGTAGTDLVVFAAGVNTVTLTSGSLNVTQSMAIDGAAAGAAKVTIQRDAAAAPFRIFSVNDGSDANLLNVSMNNLRIRNGDARTEPNTGTLTSKRGGGIDNTENLTITNSIITGNFARRGAGISHRSPNFIDGGSPRGGTLTVHNSEITGNSADYTGLGRGGALSSIFAGKVTITQSKLNNNFSDYIGGAVETSVSVEIVLSDTEMNNNMAGTGGAIMFNSQFSNDAGPPTSVLLERVQVENNTVVNASPSDEIFGIVIASQDASMIVRESVIRNNVGGIGLVNFTSDLDTQLVVERSTISQNAGGGINLNYYGGSPANATLIMRNSTVAENGMGGYFGHGLLLANPGNSVISDSTISGNVSPEGGGGLEAYIGGSPGVLNPRLDIVSSTITQNTAQSMSGATRGGGLNILALSNGAFVNTVLRNSIVSGNIDNHPMAPAADIFDYGGYYFAFPYVTGSFSLIGNNSGTAFAEGNPAANGNIVGGPIGGNVNAMLSTLALHGGPTETHLPLLGSPAINRGDMTIAGYDQRNFLRPGGPRTDMGSVESDSLDFNGDGQWNCADMDILEAAIDSGVYSANRDVNGDGVLNKDDVFRWLQNAGEMVFGPGREFKMGDANLDGSVDGSDFGIWNANKFTAANRWCQGDFNQDNFVDGSDFGIWNANKFTSSDVARGTPGDDISGVSGDSSRATASVIHNGTSDDLFAARQRVKAAPKQIDDPIVPASVQLSVPRSVDMASLRRIEQVFGELTDRRVVALPVRVDGPNQTFLSRPGTTTNVVQMRAHERVFNDLVKLRLSHLGDAQ